DDVMQDEEHTSADAQLEDAEYHEEEVYNADYSIRDSPLPSDGQTHEASGYAQGATISADDNAPISSLTGSGDPATVGGQQESVGSNQNLPDSPATPAVDAGESTDSPRQDQAHQGNEQMQGATDEFSHPKTGS